MSKRIELQEVTQCDDWAGWVIDKRGELWPPDTWRRGFFPSDLRAMFFRCQLARSLELDLRVLRADLAAALKENAALEVRAAFYRRQLVAESRLGLALSRIIDE